MWRAPGLGGNLEVRQRGPGHQVRRARSDRCHEIEGLGVDLRQTAEPDRAGVVDDDVDPTEARDAGCDGLRDLLVGAHVTGDGQRVPSGSLDLRRRGEDRPGQLGVRLGRLRGDDDVRSVAGGTERDR